MNSPLSTVARRAAARIMLSLAKIEVSEETVTESIGDGQREVLVIIRPVRYGVARDLNMEAFKQELRDRFGLEVMGMTQPAQPQAGPELKEIHQRILSKLTRQPVSLKTLARLCVLSPKSGHLREAVRQLKNWGLILCSAAGYSLPA